jgi:hypothetical protein
MKKLLLLLTFVFTISAYAQVDKTLTLVVSGQGKTQDEAKQNALRSAIEQAFGTFISSKTEILNDSLVKDEIVSVANGNIQKFEIISEIQIPNGDYATSLKATVSVTKLTSFVESKGVVVEFKGGLFASNILIQELYEKNETGAISNIVTILKEIASKSFDYSINAADPISNNGIWNIPLTVNVIANSNFINIPTLLEQTIKSISLSSAELENYSKLNKPVFPITLATLDSKGIYYLRNENSIETIIDFIYSINNSIVSFYVFNGIEKNYLTKYNIGSKYSSDCNCSISNLEIIDDNLRIILKNRNDGGGCGICAASLFHNFCGSRHDSKIPNFDYKSVYMDGMSYSIEYKDCFYGFQDKKNNYGFVKGLLKKNVVSNYPNGFKTIYSINGPLGLVISFHNIKLNSNLVQFKFNDFRTIEEIKKITKYEIIKQN